MLQRAVLMYGTRAYPVTPCPTTPLPESFDFDHPEECARLIFAIMSNASGGHTLRDCTLRLSEQWGRANLTCNGAHVYYKHPGFGNPIEVQDIDSYMNSCTRVNLGTVRTDQYGDGWKRAVWA